MKAIKFIAKVKPEKIIQILQEYAAEVSGELQVIILLKTEKEVPKVTTKRIFKAVKIKTKGFKFNRNSF